MDNQVCVCVFWMATPSPVCQLGSQNKKVHSNNAKIKQILTCNDWTFWSSLLFISISSCSNSLFLCFWASAFCSTRTLLSNASVSTRLRFNCLRMWLSCKYYNAKCNMTEDPSPLRCYAVSVGKESKIILLDHQDKEIIILRNFSDFLPTQQHHCKNLISCIQHYFMIC